MDRNYLTIIREHQWFAVSQEFADLMGYEPEEMIGRLGSDFVDDDPDELTRRVAELWDSGHQTAVTTLIHREGARIRFAYVARSLIGEDGAQYVVSDGDPLGSGDPAHNVDATRLLTKKEAATLTRLSVRTIERYIASDLLPAVTLPRAPGRQRAVVRIRVSDLEQFLS